MISIFGNCAQQQLINYTASNSDILASFSCHQYSEGLQHHPSIALPAGVWVENIFFRIKFLPTT